MQTVNTVVFALGFSVEMAGVCQPSEYLTQILPTYLYISSSQVWALQELETNWLQIPLMLKRKENLIPYLPSKVQEEKH